MCWASFFFLFFFSFFCNFSLCFDLFPFCLFSLLSFIFCCCIFFCCFCLFVVVFVIVFLVRLGFVFFGGGLDFPSLFCFLDINCKLTYVSWRLRHVVPDDVVIADIGDQPLGIFLHGPESTHKNLIGKTFTHTSIPIQPCTLLKQRAKPSTQQTRRAASFSCPLPVQCGGGRWPGSLGDAPQALLQRQKPSRLRQY